jgi:hypothetical protein
MQSHQCISFKLVKNLQDPLMVTPLRFNLQSKSTSVMRHDNKCSKQTRKSIDPIHYTKTKHVLYQCNKSLQCQTLLLGFNSSHCCNSFFAQNTHIWGSMESMRVIRAMTRKMKMHGICCAVFLV